MLPLRNRVDLGAMAMKVLWGHILPYFKDGLVQPKLILRA